MARWLLSASNNADDNDDYYDDDYYDYDYDEDEGFIGYIPETNETGSSLILTTTLFFLLSQLSLPVLVKIGKVYERKRKERIEEFRVGASGHEENEESEDDDDDDGGGDGEKENKSQFVNEYTTPWHFQKRTGVHSSTCGGEEIDRTTTPKTNNTSVSREEEEDEGNVEMTPRITATACSVCSNSTAGVRFRRNDSIIPNKKLDVDLSLASAGAGAGDGADDVGKELSPPSWLNIQPEALTATNMHNGPRSTISGVSRTSSKASKKKKKRRGDDDVSLTPSDENSVQSARTAVSAISTPSIFDAGRGHRRRLHKQYYNRGYNVDLHHRFLDYDNDDYDEEKIDLIKDTQSDVMSRLSSHVISPHDAHPEIYYNRPVSEIGEKKDDLEDKNERYTDICCGKKACWRPSQIVKSFNVLLDLFDYDHETYRILRLSLPFTLSEVFEAILENIVMALIAWNIGTDALVASEVAGTITEIFDDFVGGILDAQVTLSSHALGAGNNKLVGQYVQLCNVLFVILSLPFIAVWCLFMDKLILAFGLSQRVADIALAYTRVYVWRDLLEGVSESYYSLMDVIEREIFGTVFGGIESIVEVVFVFIALRMGANLQIIAWVQFANGLLFLLIMIGYTHWKGWIRPFARGMYKSVAFKNTTAVKNVVSTSLPLCFGSLIAEGEWEVLTVFAAYLGPAEVAAWAVLGSIWDTFEASTEGIGDAAEIRVAYYLGKGNVRMAQKSAYKSMLLATVMAFIITAAFFMMGDELPVWFTKDPTLQHMIRDLLPFVGIGNIIMTVGIVCWAIVGAQGRYRLATSVVFVISLFISLPLGSLFVYVFFFDLKCLIAAILIGYSVSGTVLMYIMLRSDWEKLSMIIREINAITGEVYSSDSSESDDSLSSSFQSSSSSSSSSDSDDSSDSSDSDDSSKDSSDCSDSGDSSKSGVTLD